jgi:hypothetical protein
MNPRLAGPSKFELCGIGAIDEDCVEAAKEDYSVEGVYTGALATVYQKSRVASSKNTGRETQVIWSFLTAFCNPLLKESSNEIHRRDLRIGMQR